jgi:hypothetical protein
MPAKVIIHPVILAMASDMSPLQSLEGIEFLDDLSFGLVPNEAPSQRLGRWRAGFSELSFA